ncbi:MAG: YggS family pyridoxal phosphate-dependent enzyme [Candidatus Peregrinibacteria bacterium]|nr:YggS family pyridoxal phosphate-dependent enzyme [Candidatus Peregrinibacteria bacterium]
MNLSANLELINGKIPAKTKLVAVTKNRPIAEIEAVIQAGATIIGENRVQEAKEKFPKLTSPVKKHLIGHLQTNKVKHAVELFDMIQSVDSLRLAKRINEEAKKQEKVIPILIQINVANDPNKHGFAVEDLFCPIKEIGTTLPNIKVKGLMAIVPYSDEPESIRPHFKKMKELFDTLKLTNFPGIEMEEISMGMSNDYELAIEEGATMVRIGRALFE